MSARYTFAVCSKCGVQSPPIIVDSEYVGVYVALQAMNWQVEKYSERNVVGICPQCQKQQAA
jgi:hypothetical protein